jgi:hypothetical protein
VVQRDLGKGDQNILAFSQATFCARCIESTRVDIRLPGKCALQRKRVLYKDIFYLHIDRINSDLIFEALLMS